METERILTMLKSDLGELFPDEDRVAYLTQIINAAMAMIRREGITLENSTEDEQLVEMYAAYLVRKRASNEGMPRMLRWALNNRLFSQKAMVDNGT